MATVSETIHYLFTDDGSLEKLKKRLKSLGKESDDTKDEIRDLKNEIERLERVEKRAAKATRQLHGAVRATEAGGRAFGGRISQIGGLVGDFEGVAVGATTALGPVGLLGAMSLLAAVAVPVGVVRTVGALLDLSRAAVDARDTLEGLGGITLVSSAGLAAVDDLEDAIDNLDRQFSRLVVELSPTLISTVDLLAELTERMGDGAERFADAFGGIDAEGLAVLLGGGIGAYVGGAAGVIGGPIGIGHTAAAGQAIGERAARALGLGTLGRSDPDEFVGPLPESGAPPKPDHGTRARTKTDEQIAAGIKFSRGPEFKFLTANTRALEALDLANDKLREELLTLGQEIVALDLESLAASMPTQAEITEALLTATGGMDQFAGEAGGRKMAREAIGKLLAMVPVIGGFLENSIAFLSDLPAFFDGLIHELTTLPVKIANGLAEVIATVPAKLIEALPGAIVGRMEGMLKGLFSPTIMFANIINAIGKLPKQMFEELSGLPVKLLKFLDPEGNGVFRGPNDRILGFPGTERVDRTPVGRDVRNLPEADIQASSRGGSAVFIGGWSEAVDALDIQQRQRRSFGGGNVGP